MRRGGYEGILVAIYGVKGGMLRDLGGSLSHENVDMRIFGLLFKLYERNMRICGWKLKG